MKRIRVPEGMLSAGRAVYSGYVTAEEGARRILEAALLWASEHPQVPTDEQWSQLFSDYAKVPHGYPPIESQLIWTLDQWQRRCFQEEEPEIPAEIEDLLWKPHGTYISDEQLKIVESQCSRHNDALSEAYRRGLRKGEQK